MNRTLSQADMEERATLLSKTSDALASFQLSTAPSGLLNAVSPPFFTPFVVRVKVVIARAQTASTHRRHKNYMLRINVTLKVEMTAINERSNLISISSSLLETPTITRSSSIASFVENEMMLLKVISFKVNSKSGNMDGGWREKIDAEILS